MVLGSNDPTDPTDWLKVTLDDSYDPDRYDYSLVGPSSVPRKLQQGFEVAGEFIANLGERLVILQREKTHGSA